ncbi:MAG: tRNA lysidine(34) synthetase TilS [Acholeplasma sp.]|nr:tRNA lysidine(34) synthetase TilS [Acholeplasma sp.]
MITEALKQLDDTKGFRLVLSVSTGVDSMVLLHALRQLDHDLVVVHFNHQKRDASLEEANYLINYCKIYNIPLEYILLEVPEQNFQDEARKQRRYYLEKVALSYHTPFILTAHHLNDLAETVLMKLSRGSNLFGYSGLQYDVTSNGFHYLKPFLSIPKKTLYEYANKEKIVYFEDDSNKSLDYTRNRYRHLVVETLITENPSFLKKVYQYSNHLFEAFSYIRGQSKSYLSHTNNIIDLSTFKQLDQFLQKDIIATLLEQNDLEINQSKIKAILSFILDAGPNQTFTLTDQLCFKKNYQKVSITKLTKTPSFRQALNLEAFNVLENMGYVTFLTDTSNKTIYEINICYNKLALPLWARQRQSGDVLEFPYGHKKLKDYYIDKKIPIDQRNKDIVITDNNNRILAVLGRYYNKSSDLTETIKLRYKRGL